MSLLDELDKTLPIKDLYDDLAKPTTREVGSALGNIAKVVRFVLAPIDFLAAKHERWQRYLERVGQQVPDDKFIEAHPQLAGPVLEGLRYVREDGLIAELFINLLARAIDRDRVSEAHPAFASIISQLSPDEALILYNLKKGRYELRQKATFDPQTSLFSQREVVTNNFPSDILAFPGNLFLYLDHLHSLNLAGVWQLGNQEIIYEGEPKQQIGVLINSVMALTPFGELFVRACVPDEFTITTGT
ncbi:MAG TPA: DUF4393 domain-containing protein [Nitrospira sp.]|nr:DUF4393 domain-containing protein [Nitrospira sp.]